jgi:hypothetical protein
LPPGRIKKQTEFAIEPDREVTRLAERIGREKHFDLEAVEAALRTAVLAAGVKVLESLLAGVGRGRRDASVFRACGARMESRGVEEKTILTLLGPVRFTRSRFQCPECRQTRYPVQHPLRTLRGLLGRPGRLKNAD